MSPQASRKITRVAVGVLLRDDGRVLLADRPEDKPYAGYWEFPGGKIEQGESVAAALERELHEELGIDIGPSVPWLTFEFDYPHAYVELQFHKVQQWRGEAHAREGQQLLFVDPAGELPRPLLPAAVPALRWLPMPRWAVLVASSGPGASPRAASGARLMVVDAGPPDVEPAAPIARDLQGEVVEAGPAGVARSPRFGWKGAWADSEEDVKVAAGRSLDFVLVRSQRLAKLLSEHPSALPVFLPSAAASLAMDRESTSIHGRWLDLRPPAPAGKGA
jgi:8-oxo-dGTP diphosphatase